MHFLPDVYVPCDTCHGKRYNRETLEVQYKGLHIAQVLDLTVEDAHAFFNAVPSIARKLQTLLDVGLGYIRLGQSATTLSGGEAQRVKLALELSKRDTGRTLYILDEPTTGLHFADIELLLKVLHALRDAGNTIVVIEHNLDVIKTADWLIDMGPEGGAGGGQVVAAGTPEEVAAFDGSHTGLDRDPRGAAARTSISACKLPPLRPAPRPESLLPHKQRSAVMLVSEVRLGIADSVAFGAHVLPPSLREGELRAAVGDPHVAERILRSPAWQDTANQQALVDIAKVSTDNGDSRLADLCEQPDRLQSTDAYGGTLLRNLDTLATQPLNRAIVRDGGGETLRQSLVDSTLADLAAPTANVTQNGANTCASTTVQIALTRDDPAEYVRLLSGLTGEDGKVAMRGGGTLGLQKESFDDGGIVGDQRRTPSEVIFQGAAMEFANGGNLDYEAHVDGHHAGGFWDRPAAIGGTLVDLGLLAGGQPTAFLTGLSIPEASGLSANMQSSLLRNIFGENYGTLYGDPNMATLGFVRTGDGEGQRAHDYLSTYRSDLPVELTYRRLGTGDFKDMHAVLFDHVDPATGSVYFQNPTGNNPSINDRAGHIDPAQPDLFYLTQDEFVNNVIWVVGPTGGAYPGPQPVVEVPTGTTSTTTAPPASAPEADEPPTATTAPQGPPTGTTIPTTTVPGG
jgi:ABC-type Na+ transport system ATPase subunit NatA